jgi:hypothetical protein
MLFKEGESWQSERFKRTLTMLRDDGAVGDDDDGPVELRLEMSDNLLSNLSESGEGSEGDAYDKGLASASVGLLVLNQIGTVDEHLGKVLLKSGVVNL